MPVLYGGAGPTWLMHGDCVEAMQDMAVNVFDAIVCDPPYGLKFMGKEWDRLQTGNNPSGLQNDGQAQQEWHFQWAKEAIRVLKPGGHLVAFGGSRTYHRLACALEDAGFEIRDSLMWLFTTGYPKSVNVAKAIDAAHGIEPEVVAIRGTKTVSLTDGGYSKRVPDVMTAAVTEEARQWEGWGTALKPAFEPIVLARKPLEGTLVDNIRKWGTGGLNVDACRIGTSKRVPTSPCRSGVQGPSYGNLRKHTGMTSGFDPNTGRWPTNVVFNDDDVAALLEEQKPGISRFFYCPKVSRKERDAGCETLPDRTARETVERNPTSPGARNPRAGAGRGADASMPVKNHHPTVKPVALMEWLVRLVTPPSGIVLDPFAGSGSTGLACQQVGVRFLGIEREAEYIAIAKARLKLG